MKITNYSSRVCQIVHTQQSHLVLLDRYEGYPSHYFKQDLPVKLNNSKELTAMVYIMNLKQQFGLPSDSYYETVSQGYKDCGFDLKTLNDAVTDSAEKYYENFEQNNLFNSPDDEDFTNVIGGMSL